MRSDAMHDACTVLIPALNAAKTLPSLLEELKIIPGIREVIVIDDGSIDETGTLALAHGARLLRHERNRGKGAALKTGFAAVREDAKTGCVVTMDADLQHDPSDLPKFLAARWNDRVPVAVGYRRRLNSGMPFARVLSNTITSLLVSARTGHYVRDSQCGYRLIGKEVLRQVRMDSEGFEAETEFLIRAARQGFPIAWIPIRTVYQGESSTMTHWTTTKRFVQVLLKEY